MSLKLHQSESDYMKKRVLILMPSMFIGGAERSLIGLLDTFDYSKYDVDLFLYRHEGELLKYIPKNTNLLPKIDKYGTFDVPIASLIKSKFFLFAIARIIGKLRLKLKSILTSQKYGVWASMQYISRSLLPLLPKIKGDYDLAISFLGIADVLIKKVSAKKKIAWNHTDYSTLLPDKSYDIKIYSKLDAVVSVSTPCTQKFIDTYPQLSNKAITIENILSRSFIMSQAEEKITDFNKSSSICLLSVGRFCEAKNFDNIPEILKKIRAEGIDAKWYIIGSGGDEELIKSKISQAKIEDYVIILGKKENPYPYIKACDIYVQPSRYEGKCVSVIEAQILGKPVIITNYDTAQSQLKDGIDGVIVPMDNNECAAAISKVIMDSKLREHLINNALNTDYSNSHNINSIYKFLENYYA